MLDKFLEKLGITGYDELNREEKEVYNRLQEALAKQVTLDDVKKFLEGEIERLEMQLLDFGNPKDKDLFLKARIRNYKMLGAFINAPEKAKENVINMIKATK